MSMMEIQGVLMLTLVAEVLCRSSQPNVLLIIVDDLRPTLGCYGDPLAVTPNIDALSHQATIFTRAYAQQALCGPSRTSFLTSRRPDTTRLYDVHSYWRTHAGNFTTLPQYFKEHGYHTAAAGKVFHPGIVSNHSDDQPFSWSETPYHPPTQAHKQDPVCLGPDGSLHTNIYCPVQVEEQPGGSLPDIETTHYSTTWLHDWAARAAIRGQPPPQPFFLAVGYHKPHIPLKFPKQFLDLYPISSVPLAPNRWLPKGLPPVAWNPWNDLRSREDIAALNVSFPYGPLPDFYARYIRQGYYAATSYTDSLIGNLVATVDHLFPDTIIALIGDHGWSLGEHQEWSKFSNFEVSTRVPFIIRNWRRSQISPSQPMAHDATISVHGDGRVLHDRSPSRAGPGAVSQKTRTENVAGQGVEYNGLVELVDLFPTLVDLAGLPTLPPCPRDSHRVKVCSEGTSLSQVVDRGLNERSRNTADADGQHRNDDEELNSWAVATNEILFHPGNDSTVSNAFQSEESRHTIKRYSIKHKDYTTHEPSFRNSETNKMELVEKKHERAEFAEVSHRPIKSLRTGKRAAFSQYPRPASTPSRNPDSDQPPTRDTTIMGYSVRTDRFRYTAWLKFDNVTYRPDWNHIIAQELYDHKIDPLEDHNVVGTRPYTQRRKQLYSMLRGGWRRAVRWRF